VIASYLNQKNGLEGTTYIAYDFNNNNNTTDYHSGQGFHIDATAAWHFIEVGQKGKYGVVGVGATGFYLQQTTGDSGSGCGSIIPALPADRSPPGRHLGPTRTVWRASVARHGPHGKVLAVPTDAPTVAAIWACGSSPPVPMSNTQMPLSGTK